jgi:hypothetical protein
MKREEGNFSNTLAPFALSGLSISRDDILVDTKSAHDRAISEQK